MTRARQSFAIVPAAGRSVRMGQPKLLLPWGATTILEQVLSVWRQAGVTATIVVAHPEDRELAELARAAGAIVVVPAIPPPHMKDSVVAALNLIEERFAPATNDVWLLAPADVPSLSPDVIKQLLREYERRPDAILVPRHGNRSGHPVLIPWSFAQQVRTLRPDQGINSLVDAGPTRFVMLGAQSVPSDIDTREDYEREQKVTKNLNRRKRR